MNINELIEHLNTPNNWTKDKANKDIWSYSKITKVFSIGRQINDWAIFKNGNNMGFYFTEKYSEIPSDMVDDLLELLEVSTNSES